MISIEWNEVTIEWFCSEQIGLEATTTTKLHLSNFTADTPLETGGLWEMTWIYIAVFHVFWKSIPYLGSIYRNWSISKRDTAVPGLNKQMWCRAWPSKISLLDINLKQLVMKSFVDKREDFVLDSLLYGRDTGVIWWHEVMESNLRRWAITLADVLWTFRSLFRRRFVMPLQ